MRLCATAFLCGLAWARVSAMAQEPPTYEISDFGVVPRAAGAQGLLISPAVQHVLKFTEAQKKEQTAILERRLERVQKARTESKDQAAFRAARNAILSEFFTAQLAILSPEQRERLSQIQLQAQGPLAFTIRERNEGSPAGAPDRFIGPPLSQQLKMTDDQVKRVRTIVEDGVAQIEKAAKFPLPLDSKETPTEEGLRKLVKTPEFRAAKEKARRAAREAWNTVIGRFEAVLNGEQRSDYRKILGKPFDLAKLNREADESETEADVRTASRALGFGGQRADPGFNTTVAHPTFTSWRPRVAIDEAHSNFHTAVGRYKPFADLMTNDGFLVARNTEVLTSQTLSRYDIFVTANATSANRGQSTGASRSAFTEDECSAVQRWVWDGGSLLLITDHEPYGSASQPLAHRFGVFMNTSATRDTVNMDRENGGLVFTRASQLILDHPVTIGRDPSERINRVKTFTGQALIGPVGSTPFLRFADTATYRSTSGEQSAAGWAQGVALSYGAGRVVVMGEAAELSAQLAGLRPMGMNAPGIDNRQMALNIMHWLSRQLDPPIIAVTTETTYYLPQRRRVFPCLFPRRPLAPASAGSGW